MRRFPFALLLPAIAGVAAAQTAAFEVASIKLHRGEVTFSADPSIRGSRVTGTAITLVDLLTYAYSVRYDQIAGAPAWAKSEHYDIEAKAAGEALTKPQAREMMQTLLAERFHLAVHREKKDVPAYALVVAKNGHKLKPGADEASPGRNFVTGSAKGMHMEASRGTMEQLARQLSNSAGRPVVDRTGLTGYYAYAFDWQPAGRTPEPDSDTPSMFTAIQEQLGLKLEPAKAPFDMLVIDRAERSTEN